MYLSYDNSDAKMLSGKVVKSVEFNEYSECIIAFEDGTVLRIAGQYESDVIAEIISTK